MLVIGAMCCALAVGEGVGLRPDTAKESFSPPAQLSSMALPAADDTVRKRKKAIQLSEWYGRRLTIHRYVAYGTLPVFAAQWAAGKRLYDDSREAPEWAKTTHRVGATALAAGFTVNTVTGLWNLWDIRSQESGRALRIAHGLTILLADAAFTYTGAKLSEEAEQSQDKRRQHRTVALSAMAVTTISGVAMKLFNK